MLLTEVISRAYCKTAVTPVRRQWSYYSLALSHRFASVLTNCVNLSFTLKTWSCNYTTICKITTPYCNIWFWLKNWSYIFIDITARNEIKVKWNIHQIWFAMENVALNLVLILQVLDLNLVITVPPDGLASKGARPSAGTLLTEKSNMFSLEIFWQ